MTPKLSLLSACFQPRPTDIPRPGRDLLEGLHKLCRTSRPQPDLEPETGSGQADAGARPGLRPPPASEVHSFQAPGESSEDAGGRMS